jgi:ATP-dependent DNA helicase RecQ
LPGCQAAFPSVSGQRENGEIVHREPAGFGYNEATRTGPAGTACQGGRTLLLQTRSLEPLDAVNLGAVAAEFVKVMGPDVSIMDITKFLSGINSPLFVKFNVRKLPTFGILEKYPFLAVKSWVARESPLAFPEITYR